MEAARAESAQNWMGIGLTSSCQVVNVLEARLLLPYDEHIKKNIVAKVRKFFLRTVFWIGQSIGETPKKVCNFINK